MGMRDIPNLAFRLLSTAAAAMLLTGCAATREAATAGPATVVWISFDGIRPDYLDRAETPAFDKLRRDGAYSLEAEPVFPSLTFSTHVSKATGVLPGAHGVTGNSFYDDRTRRIYRFPGDAALLEAEPIWLNSEKQGVRTAVVDWPLSHNQRGDIRSSYHGEAYPRGLADGERTGRLLEIWENDREEPPLRLLMGYGESPDKEGHAHGPDSPEVDKAMAAADALLGSLMERIKTLWEERAGPDAGPLYVIITSDHGMSETHTLVHPGHLSGLEGAEGVTTVTSANIAHFHFDQVSDGDRRREWMEGALEAAAGHDFVRAFRREELPERWNYAHPHRAGDVVMVLDTGYTFSRRPRELTLSAEEVGGPLGMHGYDPAENREMLTPLFIYRHPDPLGGLDLGPVHHLQLHAVVSRLLGIDPVPEAAPGFALPWLDPSP